MMKHPTPKDLKNLGCDLLNKHKRTFDDEEQALDYFRRAAESGQIHGIDLSECYKKSAEIYKDRVPKTKENYLESLKLYTKATEVSGLPSWFTPEVHAERLALCPDIYGFESEWRDEVLAQTMHERSLQRQNGGDLTITALDWFKNHLEQSNIVNPKYTKIGLDYLNNALERGWDDLWTSVMYMTYGTAYKFHSEKTTESFEAAVSWFNESIKLDVNANNSNQPWSIIGRGTARAYFELAELLSNPVRFGFNEALKREDEGRKKFQEGIEHISKYGPLGPYSIIESMYVDVWGKRFIYGRTEEDLSTIKELCSLGRELGSDKNAALYLFEGVAHDCIQNKTSKDYRVITESYFKALDAYKSIGKGHDWIAEQTVKWASPLVMNVDLEKFSDDAEDLESICKLQDLLNEISKEPQAYNCSMKIKEIIDTSSKEDKAGDKKQED